MILMNTVEFSRLPNSNTTNLLKTAISFDDE